MDPSSEGLGQEAQPWVAVTAEQHEARMRERAESVSALVEVTSTPGLGTTVRTTG